MGLAVLCGASLPSHATTSVTVSLRVSLVGYGGPVVAECGNLSVPAGSGGTAVLAAAKRSGCIADYTTLHDPKFGTKVVCIDVGQNVCEVGEGLVAFWAYYRSGASQTEGIDSFNATPNAELGEVYTNFALCPTYPDPCPL